MNKPFSMRLRETQKEIVQVLNDSGLPIDVMAMVLEELATAVREQADASWQKDEQDYLRETEPKTAEQQEDT